MPAVSIIIPSHNRKVSLKRSLDALNSQIFDRTFEVVIVLDGCTDDTIKMLELYEASFKLTIVEQEGQGAAAARNAGAKKALAPLLLFLDDDIEATNGLVKAHFEAHQTGSRKVVIGYLPPVFENQKGFFRWKLRQWWEAMFDEMRQANYRFSYRNLLSGNFSVCAKIYNEAGGFSQEFKCQEDYEFGFRLAELGCSFQFAPSAMGSHHEVTNLNRSLDRKYLEGKAAVQFITKYPCLKDTIPILNYLTEPKQNYYKKVFLSILNSPFISSLKAYWSLQLLLLYERLNFRIKWQKRLDKLLGYWYLKGVAEAAGSFKVLSDLMKVANVDSKDKIFIDINLSNGLEEAEDILDQLEPAFVRFFYDKELIGVIDTPGYEKLKGIHLRRILATKFFQSLYNAIQKIDPHLIGLEETTTRFRNKGSIHVGWDKFNSKTEL